MGHPRRPSRLSAATAAATATAVILCLAPHAMAVENNDDTNTVQFSVSNITDFHGHIEQVVNTDDEGNIVSVEEAGAALLTGMVDHLRAESADGHFLTTSGDNVGGSAFTSMLLNDQPTLAALNAMGVDVSAVGNHEFDQGYDDLLDRIIPGSEYPILGANVQRNGEQDLDPYEIQTVTDAEGNAIDVAFIGAVTEQTANKVSPAGIAGVTFDNPWEVTNQIAAELKDGDQGNGEADVVIALFHEGATPDQFTDSVDAVFAGDTHQEYQSGPGETPVVMQALEYGKRLANLDFTYDIEAGELTNIEQTMYTADEMAAIATPDAEVAAAVAEASAQAEEVGSEEITELVTDFTRGARGEAGPGSNRGVESTLNNLIAEAQRVQMSEVAGQDIDLGLMNAGGVREDLAAGQVTYRDAYDVQPFGNDVMYGKLTGADILEALEQQWKDPTADRPRLNLGVSNNFSYSYDPEAEQGERVIQATINDQPLDPAATYTVAASTFLFEGGDGFEALTRVQEPVNAGVIDVAAFIDYLQAADDLTPRESQSAVGINIAGTVAPGQTITLELSSLAYTVDPTVTTVTARLGEVEESAPVDTTVLDEGYGNTGTATIELSIPADFSGEGVIEITTDAGTQVFVPITGQSEQGGTGSLGFDFGSSELNLGSLSS